MAVVLERRAPQELVAYLVYLAVSLECLDPVE